nr:NAC domain-containing protein 53-like [Aegilops tauschii subsp. strangulata]XP_045090293.1 NAC domain-containing protein 53-like [Aegilops tauschii subsp. strangulata]
MAPVAEIRGLTPGYKFMPADEEVIEFYLIPRLRGQPLPLDGVIIDEDPRSAPPWKLFERNGLDEVDVEHAFFFTSGEYAKSAKRKVRACAGGTWVGMKVGNKGKLRLGGETFAWQVYRMNYLWGAGRRTGSTGWVMLEYSISHRPTVLPSRCARSPLAAMARSGNGCPTAMSTTVIAAAPLLIHSRPHCHLRRLSVIQNPKTKMPEGKEKQIQLGPIKNPSRRRSSLMIKIRNH